MSVNNYQIPLTNSPQTFQILLAGVTYTVTCKWNAASDGGWVLDFADINSIPIACNIPLITGDDCLDGLAYLGFGGSLYVQSTGTDPFAIPTYDNLGTDSFLYFQTSSTDE